MNDKLHKSVYIPSIEASDIYSHMFRDKDLKIKYIGMIPSSLELDKLIDIGLKVKKNKTSDKLISDDIINIKFTQKSKSAKELIPHVRKKILSIPENASEKQNTYKNNLTVFLEKIENEQSLDKWYSLSSDELRMKLYTEGFTITSVNKRTFKTKEVKYVVYKRSSAKSRVGQCLFIKESLANTMINWSQMNIPLMGADIDVPSFLAYQSLIGSALEDTIRINPDNILLVDDIESIFSHRCNVVRKSPDGNLDSFLEDIEIKNSLFDGQSLLDSSYFSNGKSMMLLRNHMYKSAAFNCNIQDFLKDYFKKKYSKGNYEEWQIPTMFKGKKIFAKDVHLITAPSSLKALKFSSAFGSDEAMFEYWKNYIKDSSGTSLFGIVKHEKASRYGDVQQTSYQMINSLPISRSDLESLTAFEIEYIIRIKNDDETFINHILMSANDFNSNKMFVELYRRNPDVVRTKIFKDFRATEIKRHVIHVKNGKIRLDGDYCTMLGNPIEFLYHAVGDFDVKHTQPKLVGNEIHTSLFEFDTENVGFRNPHTSPSNVLVVKNVDSAEITKYLNLTPNIVCVNAINFPLQDILSGSDYDSDTVLLMNNTTLLQSAKKCFGKYRVCVNNVPSSKKKYKMTNSDIAKIDAQLALSQKNIGRVVNLGQFCMSVYWHLLNNNSDPQSIDRLLKKIDVMTVLSGICIDLAKKFFDIEIDKEVNAVANIKELKRKKPLFWKFVNQYPKKIKTEFLDCPMDNLFEIMSKIEYAEDKDEIAFKELLIPCDHQGSYRIQISKVISYIEHMDDSIRSIYAGVKDEKERMVIIQSIMSRYERNVSRLKINSDTMYALLLKTVKNKRNIASMMMNTLYKTHKETFINAFFASKTIHFYFCKD